MNRAPYISEGKKIIIAIAALVGVVLIGYGCSEDPGTPVGDCCLQPAFRDLTAHDDVLFNLGLAYNQFNLNEYSRLLDDNFIFDFSAQDIQQGHVQVAQWDRASELAATANIFNVGALPPGVDPISDIALDLYYRDGSDDWQPVAPPDPQQYPGETWYYQQIDYFLTVVSGSNVYTSGNPLKADFVLRPRDDGTGKTVWRIISWRDVGQVAALVGGAQRGTSVDANTWGGIKVLFSTKKKDQ